jgi:hypothetical protein
MKKGKLGITKLPRWLVRIPPKFARASIVRSRIHKWGKSQAALEKG